VEPVRRSGQPGQKGQERSTRLTRASEVSVPLSFTPTSYGDLTLLGVEGPVTARSATAFRKQIDATLTARPQAVILDLALVSRLDQAGVGMLLHTATRCRIQGCALALCRVPDHVLEILAEERVKIPVYPTLADATETLLYAAAWR
jgi:anti-anti-sigma factor